MLDTPADEISNLSAWLESASAVPGFVDLPRLRTCLAQLEQLPLDVRHMSLLARADVLSHNALQRLRPGLRETALPLARDARARSAEASDLLDQLSRCHLRVLKALRHADSARAGLLALYRRFEVAVLAGATVPSGLWLCAGEMYRTLTQVPHDSLEHDAAQKAKLVFVRLLALSCLSPQHLSAGEIGEAVDWLDETMIPIVLHDTPPASADETWFWFDFDLDQAPRQFGRRAPPSRSGIVTFSLGPLASHALATAALLAPEQDDDAGAAEREASVAALLRRVADQFSNAHRRRLSRRRNNYRVSACIGLAEIRRLLSGDADTPGDAPPLSEWMVVNESAGGFAIMHVGGHIEGIVSGGVLALRAEDSETWVICLIRWSRSDNPAHVELGLQVLSNGAQSVEIAFRAASPGSERGLHQALLLPAVPALRPKFAILAPAGTYTSRRFVMVAQTGHVYVTQGRLISLDLQTAAVELFQFELDPYPM